MGSRKIFDTPLISELPFPHISTQKELGILYGR
jgi:hypothetical protein